MKRINKNMTKRGIILALLLGLGSPLRASEVQQLSVSAHLKTPDLMMLDPGIPPFPTSFGVLEEGLLLIYPERLIWLDENLQIGPQTLLWIFFSKKNDYNWEPAWVSREASRLLQAFNASGTLRYELNAETGELITTKGFSKEPTHIFPSARAGVSFFIRNGRVGYFRYGKKLRILGKVGPVVAGTVRSNGRQFWIYDAILSQIVKFPGEFSFPVNSDQGGIARDLALFSDDSFLLARGKNAEAYDKDRTLIDQNFLSIGEGGFFLSKGKKGLYIADPEEKSLTRLGINASGSSKSPLQDGGASFLANSYLKYVEEIGEELMSRLLYPEALSFYRWVTPLLVSHRDQDPLNPKWQALLNKAQRTQAKLEKLIYGSSEARLVVSNASSSFGPQFSLKVRGKKRASSFLWRSFLTGVSKDVYERVFSASELISFLRSLSHREKLIELHGILRDSSLGRERFSVILTPSEGDPSYVGVTFSLYDNAP